MSGHRGNPEAEALLSLGSNLGKREETLLRAVERLRRCAGVRVEEVSSLYETEPAGYATGRVFINAACALATTLSPRELLDLCLGIEREFGRKRGGGSPDRTLDLDILAYGGLEIREDDLAIPHPRLRERPFVLVPLVEIRPAFHLPPDGKTILEILRECAGGGWTQRVSSEERPAERVLYQLVVMMLTGRADFPIV